MKILLTGATGLVGKEVGKKLVEAGHELIVLSRDIKSAKSMLPFPVKIYAWKGHLETIPLEALDGVESVINLAGESIASGRWSHKRKALIYDSRINGTKQLVKAISKNIDLGTNQVKQLISASAIGIYGDSIDKNFTETSPSAQDFLSKVCADWEKESQELSKFNIKVINPRIGIVLSRQGGAMDKMLPLFSLGLGGVIGSGKQWMSWIHLEDLSSMFCHFIQHSELSGAFNAVAPEPKTNKDFSNELATSLARSLFLPVPPFALKIGLGEMSTLVTGGQKVSCEKVLNTGFNFKYPTLNSALTEICSPLRDHQKEILAEQWVPKKANDIFPFFCDEKNLEKLTPTFLNFKVLGKSTPSIMEGTLINYRLGLHSIPLKWQSQILDWKPGHKFVDQQIKGPYSKWHHTHEFIDFAGGTLMRDRVLYKVPMGWLGDLFAGQKIKKDVTKIFNYRRKIVSDLFN